MRTFLLCIALGTLLSMAGPRPAAAHGPTPQGNESWHTVKTTEYKFASSMEPWIEDVVDNVLQSRWQDRSTNNSDSVVFNYNANSSGKGIIHFTNSAPFCGLEWLGCADSTILPDWDIWIQSNPGTVDKGDEVDGWEQWCDLDLDPGCPDAGRVVIHEAGHIGDIAHYDTSSWTRTRMQLAPPENDVVTWDTRTLGPCDEATLQLVYDLWSKWFQYSKCLDHVSNAEVDVGLKTALTTSFTSMTVCANTTVTVTGRLDVKNEDTYRELKNNGLAGRTVSIDRGSVSNYTSTQVDSTTDDNWSKAFTHSNITYNYVAHYDSPSDEGLADSPNRAFSITWLSPQVPCDP